MTAAAPPLATDAVLGRRDTLLDARAMGDRLGRVLGLERPLAVEGCRRVLAHYDPGRRLSVVYRLRADGVERRVVATLLADADRARAALMRAAASAPRSGPIRGVAQDHETGALLWTFPHDPRLAHLSALADGSRAVPGLLGDFGLTTRLVSYVPERRAVARCVDGLGIPVAYAKVYRGGDVVRVHRMTTALARRLEHDPHLRVPRILVASPARDMLVSEAIGGTPLSETHGERLVEGLCRLGTGLARLHGLVSGGSALSYGLRVRRRVVVMAALIGAMRPDARADAEALVRTLGESVPEGGPMVVLHGDAALKNAVLGDDRVTLVDLDEMRQGPAAADLGRVLSWIRAERVMDRLTDHEGQRLMDALIDGYRTLREPPPAAEIRWYAAAKTLQVRCRKAVTRLHPEYGANLVALLRDAREGLA